MARMAGGKVIMAIAMLKASQKRPGKWRDKGAIAVGGQAGKRFTLFHRAWRDKKNTKKIHGSVPCDTLQVIFVRSRKKAENAHIHLFEIMSQPVLQEHS